MSRIVVISLLFLSLLAINALAQSAGDEILAAYTKMQDLKTYRVKTTVTPGGEAAAEMQKAKSMGMNFEFKPILQEVVNPDLRKMTMEMPLMSMGSMSMPAMPSPEEMRHMTPQQMQQMAAQMQQMQQGGGSQMPQMVYVKMYGVSQGDKAATYMDCVECEKKINESMKKQLDDFAKEMTRSLLSSVLQGPQALAMHLADQVLNKTIGNAVMQAQVNKEKEMMSLNRWTCRNRTEEGIEKQAAPSFPNAKALGTEKVGSEDAKTYQFDVTDQNTQQTMPVKLYVSAASGTPLKMEMSQKEGSITMEFYDFNSDIKIDVPDCMK